MRAPPRRRADRVLVERGLFESRAKAQAAIEAGLVRAGGETLRRPSDAIAPDAAIEAGAPHPWVSRGGVKLDAALAAFGLDPSGLACLDVGASTGGFTDALLARGAARVTAADVGHGQLHPRLAADPRVTSLEGVDARALADRIAPAAFDLAALDVSFISLRLVLPAILPLLRPGGALVALVKPQFEVGRAAVAQGRGIVRDAALREAAIAGIVDWAATLGLATLGVIPSPILGGDGNHEALLGARRHG